jgi:hypothetical protein
MKEELHRKGHFGLTWISVAIRGSLEFVILINPKFTESLHHKSHQNQRKHD